MNPATRTPHDRAAVTIVATQLFFLLSGASGKFIIG